MKRTAFIRCWNEENTIIASLLSIENIFSTIVIIHSDVTDSSLSQIEKYTEGRTNIIVEKYPYKVYPPHDNYYKNNNIEYRNSMAGYTNFGMDLCKKVGGIIALVDADQIYIEDVFAEQILRIEEAYLRDQHIHYVTGNWGINSFVHDDYLLVSKQFLTNGGNDSYIMSPHTPIHFFQNAFYEIARYDTDNLSRLPNHKHPSWFHFMKRFVGVKSNNESFRYSNEEYVEKNMEDVVFLSNDLILLFESKVRPLLVKANSPYKNLLLEGI